MNLPNLETLSGYVGHKVLAAQMIQGRRHDYIVFVRMSSGLGTPEPVYEVWRGPSAKLCERYGDRVLLTDFRRVPCFTRAEERAFPKVPARIGSAMVEAARTAKGGA